jgi:hypothetical protein
MQPLGRGGGLRKKERVGFLKNTIFLKKVHAHSPLSDLNHGSFGRQTVILCVRLAQHMHRAPNI